MSTDVMDYDPNLTNSGRRAIQTVRLVFALWEYRYETTVSIGGNCRGLSVIKAAIAAVFESLWNEARGVAVMVLTKPGDDTMTNDELSDEDDLERDLIFAEIVSITPKEI